MKKFYYLMLISLLGWSCQKDQEQLTPVDPVPEAEISYVVPVEEALRSLEMALDRIDGEATRVGGRRTVKSIERVKAARAMRAETRATGDQPAVEDLFYLVSFGEGQGSAVLGADRRLESIYAILDETVLTPEDFDLPTTTRSELPAEGDSIRYVSTEEELADFVAGMIVNAITFPPTFPDPGIPELPRQHWERFIDTLKHINIAPCVRTKWHQSAPYNSYAEKKLNNNGVYERCKAGCTPIAIAQFLTALRIPNTNTINGTTYSWARLSRCEYGDIMNQVDSMHVGLFVRSIGDAVNADWGLNATGAWLHDYEDELAEAGVTADECAYSATKVELALRNYGAICMSGWGIVNGVTVGHTWVIDGADALVCEDVYRIVQDLSGIIVEETRTPLESNHQLFHCNYGWGGTCDGYYTYGAFDTTQGPVAGYEPSIGDLNTTQPYNFNQNFIILEYNF